MDYSYEDVLGLPADSDLFSPIAMYNPDPQVARFAARQLRKESHLHMLAICPESDVEARMWAIERLTHNEDLMVEIAIRDDHFVLAMFAGNQVRTPRQVRRLYKSKYESVRLFAVMRERDVKELAKYLNDESKDVRDKVQERLRSHTLN